MSSGYEEASSNVPVDLCVINTCTVTSTSDDKSRQQIRKVIRKNPDATVIVTGCYAESDAEAIRTIEGVGYVFEKGRESKIIEFVKNGFITNNNSAPVSSNIRDPYTKKLRRNESAFNLKVSKFDGHTRAFLKIEDGCDIFCSYCIIPYVRGKVTSKKIGDILFEAEQLVSNGYKEIVLTGIHLGAYGKETGYQQSIIDVLSGLQTLPGLERIRLSSIEVNEVTDDLIDIIADSDRVCHHFHLPLQSGDDYILKRMNRKYNAAQYLKTVERIKERLELPSISTDVLVGFPGEKRVHFENTMKLCEQAGFSRTHIFPYSPREDTPAAKMPDHCNPSEIKERKKELESLAAETSQRYKNLFVGRDIGILVENTRDRKTGKLCGYSDRYIKVFFDGPDDLMNEIVDVHVERVLPQSVVGKCRSHAEHGDE